MLLADIANGNTDAADVFFLFAVILAVVGAVVAIVRPPYLYVAHGLAYLALGCVALGFLLL